MKESELNRENIIKEVIDRILILVTINELSNKEFITVIATLCNMDLGNESDNNLFISDIQYIIKRKSDKYFNKIVNESLDMMHSPSKLPVFSTIK